MGASGETSFAPWPGIQLQRPVNALWSATPDRSAALHFHYPKASRHARASSCVICLHDSACVPTAESSELDRWRLHLKPAYLSPSPQEPPVLLDAACCFTDLQLSHLLLALVEEQEAGYPSGPRFGETVGTAIGLHLRQHYRRTNVAFPGGGGTPPSWLAPVLGWIHQHWNAPVRVDKLASLAGLSPCHFLRQFKRAVGLTPHQYVMRFRVEQARGLLANSNLPLVQVALEAGFPNQSHFGTTFRRMTGITPARYRAGQSPTSTA